MACSGGRFGYREKVSREHTDSQWPQMYLPPIAVATATTISIRVSTPRAPESSCQRQLILKLSQLTAQNDGKEVNVYKGNLE